LKVAGATNSSITNSCDSYSQHESIVKDDEQIIGALPEVQQETGSCALAGASVSQHEAGFCSEYSTILHDGQVCFTKRNPEAETMKASNVSRRKIFLKTSRMYTKLFIIFLNYKFYSLIMISSGRST